MSNIWLTVRYTLYRLRLKLPDTMRFGFKCRCGLNLTLRSNFNLAPAVRCAVCTVFFSVHWKTIAAWHKPLKIMGFRAHCCQYCIVSGRPISSFSQHWRNTVVLSEWTWSVRNIECEHPHPVNWSVTPEIPTTTALWCCGRDTVLLCFSSGSLRPPDFVSQIWLFFLALLACHGYKGYVGWFLWSGCVLLCKGIGFSMPFCVRLIGSSLYSMLMRCCGTPGGVTITVWWTHTCTVLC